MTPSCNCNFCAWIARLEAERKAQDSGLRPARPESKLETDTRLIGGIYGGRS